MGDNKNDKPKSVEELLKLLSTTDNDSTTQQKLTEDYKFWKTQPVPKLEEKIDSEGPIDSSKTPDDIPDKPLPLLPEFEWVTVDINNSEELEDVYQLLYNHYVEDLDATFRFKYSHEFFKWSLKPPGWLKEWHVGVRVKATGKLVAFIAAVPTHLKLNSSGKNIPSVEINFLCIHKKLRGKRLAPVLIKEINRRVNKRDIWQALYTGGVILPSPVSTCRYTHRPINWSKLYDVGFSHLPANQTKASMLAYYSLPPNTKTEGLRPMTLKDLDATFDLFVKFQSRYTLVPDYSKDEFAHWTLGSVDGAKSNVIKTFVVEDPASGTITDFFSYYLLPFTVLDNPHHNELGIAYLFYYASKSGIDTDSKEKLNQYKSRLKSLINDALITAKADNVDVFNCLTSQDNPLFVQECKFGAGDGYLNYYLFNYKTLPIPGGIDSKTKEVTHSQGSGIGVVLF